MFQGTLDKFLVPTARLKDIEFYAAFRTIFGIFGAPVPHGLTLRPDLSGGAPFPAKCWRRHRPDLNGASLTPPRNSLLQVYTFSHPKPQLCAMGHRKRRLERFLRSHPTCCYCGGETPADTQDHWPPRTFFVGRNWPSEFVFPACSACNEKTSRLEGMFALLCRMGSPVDNAQAAQEIRLLFEGQQRRHPEILQSLALTTNEKRSLLRSTGRKLPPGMLYRDAPITQVTGAEARHVLETCLQKLLLSLHYRHSASILPKSGVGFMGWFGNTTPMPDDTIAELPTKLPRLELPKFQKNDISTQFSYRYTISNDGSATGFFINLGNTFGVLGFLCSDPSRLSDSSEQIMTRFTAF